MASSKMTFAAMYLRRLLQLETVVLLAAFAILIAVVFTDVVLRRLTGSGLLWSRDIGIYANIWLSLIGIGIASAQGSHLRPRFLDAWVRPGWERWLRPMQEWLTALGFAALAAIAWSVVQETRELGDANQVLRWPVWILQLCMPLAFLFAASKHVIFALRPDLRPGERDEASEAPRP